MFNHLTGKIVKDLSLITGQRRIEDIVMVDNCYEGVCQHQNLVPITNFYGSKTDDTLKSLKDYLKQIISEEDVRSRI